ncbi:glycosyltransferase family 4 protein [Portibacter marinus]|uniref:glycosyltransferase family 4 protein n=1 Tax=Portibacter marinus TaxID=2898660 RepID=UPI001F3690C1|nr:glycosyltransferase family 1 protein [Portibacter marinus]
MRIAVNTRMLLKHRMEGICRYIHETTKRMVLAHPEDDFIFFFDRPFHPSFIYGPNVTPVVLPPPTRDPILWKIWFDFVIPRALNKYQADVFLSGDTYMSLKTDVPTVIVSHDIAYHHFPEHLPRRVLNYYRNYFPEFHKKAAHIIAVSEFTKQDIIKAYGLNPEKITVAHNAAPQGFRPFSSEEKKLVQKQFSRGKPFFIYVGSLHPRKNIKNLILGFIEYKSQGGKENLILLGRKAWNYSEFEQLIASRNDTIWLDGNHIDPREVLPAAEALVYVSLHEGFGIPILEGMSSGVPVITSDVSSMPEVAGKAAILVDPSSPQSIRDGMTKVKSSNLESESEVQLKHFSWDKSASVIYKSLIL